MLDLDHCARTQLHEVFRRIFEPDTHREALRNPHPIHRPFHVRHRTWEIDALLIQNAPPDAIDDAFDWLATVDHRKDSRAIPDRNGLQIGFSKVGDGEPFFRTNQGEQCLGWHNHLA